MKPLILVMLGVALGASFFYIPRFPFNRPFKEPVSVFISKGSSVSDIATAMKENGLVSSMTLFGAMGVLSGKAFDFKPGQYVFENRPSLFKLLDRLYEGPETIPFMITPGMTLREIDDRLAMSGFSSLGALLALGVTDFENEYPWLRDAGSGSGAASLEGFLLPDTYYFYKGESLGEIAGVILRNFEEKALPKFKSRDNIMRTLTIASLLEKEVLDPAEKKTVAGIIEKRLKSGMPLQVDATVVYAACEGRYLGCPPMRKEDFARPSPYNTYFSRDLPPGPISNPSISSIEAAQNSKETSFWFYLTEPKTGKAIFSEIFEEHQRNRAIYLLD